MKKLLLLLGLAAISAACKPCDDPTNPECENYCDDPANPDCFNYDPCLGKKPVSANFKIYERSQDPSMPVGWVDYDTDTLRGWGAEVVADEENAFTYEWIIGSERLGGRSITRSNFPEGRPLAVTLIVVREPNEDCFPGEDARDTVTRLFVVDNSWDCSQRRVTTVVPGKYQGYFTNDPGVLRTIRIDGCAEYLIPRFSIFDTIQGPAVFGLLPDTSCVFRVTGSSTLPAFFGYRKWVFSSDNLFYQSEVDCGSFRRGLFFQPEGTDSILINYEHSLRATPNDYVKFQFRGKKVN